MSHEIRLLRHSAVLALSIFLLSTLPPEVQAAVFYVNTTSQFSDALSTADHNGLGDTINLAPGIYTLTESLTYTPAAGENQPLVIQGAGADDTTLNGGGSWRILAIDSTGLSDDSSVSITISGISFEGGYVVGDGGGARINLNQGSLFMENNGFTANSATLAGGGLYAASVSGSVTLSSNSFNGNESGLFYTDFDETSGGGAYVRGARVSLTDNGFFNNATRFQASMAMTSGAGACVIANGGQAGALTMIHNYFAYNAQPSGGMPGGAGAYVSIQGDAGSTVPSATLTDNVFEANTYGSGLSLSMDDGALWVHHNRFLDHTQFGGVVFNLGDTANIWFAGNIVDGNADGGVSIYNPAGVVQVVNNTIINNDNYWGGGLYLHAFTDYVDTARIDNNIIYGNTATGGGGDIYINMYDIDNTPSLAFTVYLHQNTYSDLGGGCFNSCTPIFWVAGTDDRDPLLIAPEFSDYHLSVNSPCIDTGYNLAWLTDQDFEGDPRIINTMVDRGVDEYGGATVCVPEEEVCDGVDNDCDELVDEDDQENPLTQSCYSGSPLTEGVGMCVPGEQMCSEGSWGSCIGEVVPTVEICGDGLDQDCNGSDLICDSVDDDGDGYTENQGDCDDANNTIYPGATETCNGIDDDCDALIDENVTRVTTCGLGACVGNQGVETCTNGSWSGDTCDPQAGAVTETCNNLDDDCDGFIDENLTQSCYSGPVGTEGIGVCIGGEQTCSEGFWGTCVGEVLPVAEICNNLTDDDCDGDTDCDDSDCADDPAWCVQASSSCWDIQVVDDGVYSVDIYLDSEDNIHLCYFAPSFSAEGDSAVLKYAFLQAGQSSAWLLTTVDPFTKSGADCTLAVGTDGLVQIAYMTGSRLKFAWGNSLEGFSLVDVGSAKNEGNCSLVLDSENNPHIVFPADRIHNGKTVHIIKYNSGTPGSLSINEEVFVQTIEEVRGLGYFNDIQMVGSPEKPVVAYNDDITTKYGVRYALTRFHESGDWVERYPENIIPYIWGGSINLHQVAPEEYYMVGMNTLKNYIEFNNWIPEFFKSTPIGRDTVTARNVHLSLDVDSLKNPHIAFYDDPDRAWRPDPGEKNLRYLTINMELTAKVNASAPSSETDWRDVYHQVTLEIDSEGDVGKSTAVALDTSDIPYIVYLDADREKIKLARRNPGLCGSLAISPMRWTFNWDKPFQGTFNNRTLRPFFLTNTGPADQIIQSITFQDLEGEPTEAFRLVDCVNDTSAIPGLVDGELIPSGETRVFCVQYDASFGWIEGRMTVVSEESAVIAELQGEPLDSTNEGCSFFSSLTTPRSLKDIVSVQTGLIFLLLIALLYWRRKRVG